MSGLPTTKVLLQSAVEWLSLPFDQVCSSIKELSLQQSACPSAATGALISALESHPILSAISHLEPGTSSLRGHLEAQPSTIDSPVPAPVARTSRGDYRRGPIRDPVDSDTDSDEGEGPGTLQDQREGRKGRGVKKGKEKVQEADALVTWKTMAKPPRINAEVSGLVFRLANIHRLAFQKRLSAFLRGLASQPSLLWRIQDPVTVFQLLNRCLEHERNSALHDFKHMVDLIRLAVYIER
jgi:hypothetical protein